MKRKSIRIVLLMVLLITITTFSVSAQNVYDSYLYDVNGEAVAAPDAVDCVTVRDGSAMGTTALKDPSDICYFNGNLFVADAGNNRILVLDDSCQVTHIIESFTEESGADTFSAPQGLFVSQTGDIYIADTENHRIVILDKDYQLVRIIDAPRSNIFSEDFVYKPTKLAVDSAGRIFVTSSGFNMGLIQLDKDGSFVQCLGAPKVTYTFTEYFWRLFSTEEMLQRMASFVPAEYNNVAIDDENFLFVTSSAYEYWEYQNGGIQPLRKLNALGTNILKRKGNVNPYGDTRVVQVGNYRGPSTLVDVTVLGYDMYAVLDSNRCRVFAYNGEGDMLFSFGGPGTVSGAFTTPSAMEYSDGNFYILDSTKQTLTQYVLNDYGRLMYQTAVYHNRNMYDEEARTWQEILSQNRNQSAALTGMGKALYQDGDYVGAMHYFKLADDKSNYSKAFKQYRLLWINQNFAWIMVGAIAVILVITAIKIYKKFHGFPVVSPYSYRGTLGYAKRVIFHPFDGFWDLKREKRGSLNAALTILGGVCLVVIVYDCYSGYIFCPVDQADRNILLEIGKVVIPFLLFCVSNWCVTSLLGGEGSFKDIVISTAYALTPLLILLPIATIFSHVLVLEEGDFYIVVVALAFIWSAALLLCANMQTHYYKMSQELGIMVLTILIMVIVVFLTLLVFVLVQQIVSFTSDILTELSLRA